MKKLIQLIENENLKKNEFVINIANGIEDSNDKEDDDTIETEMDKVLIKTRKTICSDLNSIESNSAKKSCPIEMEKARKKLCDMIIFTSLIYLLGHLLNIICSIFDQANNLSGKTLYRINFGDLKQENTALETLFEISNVILYCSLGMNFFIYFFFSSAFRFVVEKAFKHTFSCLFCSYSCAYSQSKQEKDEKLKV